MNSNINNQMMDFDELKDLAADFRDVCNFSDQDARDEDEEQEDMEMMRCCPSSSDIFRDLPDSDYTPIEQSNDTIFLSPAWSMDSAMTDEPEEFFKPMAIMAEDQRHHHHHAITATMTTTVAVAPSQMYLNAGAAPSSSVTRISDFDMNSRTIQRLNF